MALLRVNGFLLCANCSVVLPVRFLVALNLPLFAGLMCIDLPLSCSCNPEYNPTPAMAGAKFPVKISQKVLDSFKPSALTSHNHGSSCLAFFTTSWILSYPGNS